MPESRPSPTPADRRRDDSSAGGTPAGTQAVATATTATGWRQRLRDHPQWYWLVVVAGLAAGVGIIGTHMRLTDFPIDMIIYRDGVQAFFSGREVYSEPMHAGDIPLPFIYPPFGAIALAPLAPAFIPDAVAGDILIAISGALLLASLYLVLRAVVSDAHRRFLWPLTAVAWPLGLSIEPVVLNDDFAQINVVIMALVVLDVAPRKRFLPQGWIIGLATAIKLTPAAMLLYFLVQRRVKPIITAAVSAIAATGVAGLIRWDQTKEFFTSVLLDMGGGGDIGVDPTYTSNSSIKAVLMRLPVDRAWLDANGDAINVAWLVFSLALVVFAAWLMVRLIEHGLTTEAWLVNALVMLLISPISWSHHWVWLALIFPVAGYRLANLPAWGTAEKWLAGLLGLWLVFVVTGPPKWWFGDGVDFDSLNYFARFLVSDFVWLALAVMVALTCAFNRDTSDASSSKTD